MCHSLTLPCIIPWRQSLDVGAYLINSVMFFWINLRECSLLSHLHKYLNNLLRGGGGWNTVERKRPLPQESFEESSRQVWGAGVVGQGRAWESEGRITNSIGETAGWEHQADVTESWPSCLTQLAALSLGQPCNSEGRSNPAVPVGFFFLHLLPQYFPASSTFRNKVQLYKRPLLTLVLFPAQP